MVSKIYKSFWEKNLLNLIAKLINIKIHLYSIFLNKAIFDKILKIKSV